MLQCCEAMLRLWQAEAIDRNTECRFIYTGNFLVFSSVRRIPFEEFISGWLAHIWGVVQVFQGHREALFLALAGFPGLPALGLPASGRAVVVTSTSRPRR